MDNFIMSILRPVSLTSVLQIFLTALIVSSQNSAFYLFYQKPAYPRDCKEVLDSCHYQRLSGVYAIKPDGYHKPFEVYCDTTGDSGGWTVILRRHDGSVTFQRNWLEYKLGFGFLSQELWIGTEKLSYLTNQNTYELRIDLTYSDGRSAYLTYKFFRITDDFSNYKLTSLGLYAGSDDITDCPTNMQYGTCICQSSCGCLQDCLPCSQEEACFCPSGFYLKGAECVPREECGCIVDGNTIGEGVWYVAPGCTRRYICINGNLICDNNYRCGANAVCERRNNVLGCYCNPGYIGDGVMCVTTCPVNTEYGVCTCQTHCRDPNNCLPCAQSETCYCTDGYFLENGNCVRPEQCGCHVDGIVIPEGQTYTSPGCSKMCTCTNGQLNCNNNYQCSSNAVCETRNNVLQCYCNPGYVGDGVTCVSICQANGVFGTCFCETTCANPQFCGSCTQGQPCYCPSGFYLQGSNCVRPEGCGCFTDGMIIPEGETYTSPGCSKMCTCTNGQLDCNNNYQCSPNAVCETRNNVLQCYCNPGYVGDGVTCVSICQANRVFGTCFCETTCANPQFCGSCTQGQPCYCPSGFYLQGSNCVRPEGCGCFTDGMIIPEGQTYTSPGCSNMCTCTNGQLDCNNNYQCSPDAVCETRSGVRQCYCNPGFTGDGVTCSPVCQTNRVLGTCPCETTCENPQVCGSCSQSQPCYCPSGYFIQGQDCVQQEDCGCYIDGIIVPNSETYVNTDCTQQCTCNNNQLDCDTTYQCSPNAACIEDTGVRRCVCNDGYSGDGLTCAAAFTDCYDAYQAGHRTDGIYTIRPTGWPGSPFEVFCNMTFGDGGWTVFQRRIDGVTDFYRTWTEYKQGFGTQNQGNDFWLGNEQLHYLTDQKDYILRIDFVHSSDTPYYEEYRTFKIGDESTKYRLSYGSYKDGNTGYYNLYYNNGQQFSTRDQDNDGCNDHNFAERQKGGWWYTNYWCTNCFGSYCYVFEYGSSGCNTGGTNTNLNGDYNGGNGENIFYGTNGPNDCNHKFAEMKIRPINT
ncbi:Zonadhesin [Holothuria leucospilota]|uniref:Zonadhesin n=1 Tax=Holothuria leucospilota TaxID=206669 RepID=A0A9Q1BWJ7_HOLLE|nr:Zonadhesin [Holothuria leucospilota]